MSSASTGTPYRQHLPAVSAADDAPVPFPTATVTPQPPTPTRAAQVRGGATPTPTPFPPGPPSKLGVFVGYKHAQLFDLLHTGNVAVVKTLEVDPTFLAEIKRISPQTIVIARLANLEENVDWLRVDPKAFARSFVDRLLPLATDPKRWAYVDAWEAYNEPVVVNAEAMARLADFEAERTRLLAREGVWSCVGNFPAGHPDLPLWPHFFPALQAIEEHGGYLGLHEYSAPYMWFGTGRHQLSPSADEGDEGWLTLRYRKAYRQYLQPAGLDVPLVITEAGIDGAVQPRPGPKGLGWKDFAAFWEQEGWVTTTPAGFYVEQLAWYDAHLMQDPYVVGAAIYALVVYGNWESFEIVGECARILQQYLAVHPPRS